MSLVRLLSHPRLMADRPLSLGKAWGVFEAFAALPGVAMLHEPQGVDATLGALVKDKLPARLFTDAYFAALARVAGLRLVTFDKDFERFSGLANLRLTKQRNA
jgi:predicted nucleic acid-binding protein